MTSKYSELSIVEVCRTLLCGGQFIPMLHHIIFDGLIVSYLKIFLLDPIYLIVR